jgi:hypothetical protein
MIPSLVTLSLRAHGLPQNIAKLIGTTLVKMRYKIKTKLGISARHYNHSPDEPIYGTGQGSAGSMAFWLLISAILFGIMEQIAHGLTFTDPNETKTIKRTMEGFVDDTDVAINDAHSNTQHTPKQLVQTLQTDAQHWESLLFISGGKLELNKCFFYALTWKFGADGTPSPLPKEQIPYQLMLNQGNDDEPTVIKQKDCTESHRTLGIMEAPNRSQHGEIQRLTDKCKEHAQAILSKTVTSSDSTVAHSVYHLTSIGYSLSTTCMLPKELTKSQGRAVSAFLATRGCNRNLECRLVFSPRTRGGIGMTPLLLLQGQQSIKLLRRHLLHHTELGLLISIDIAWTQQEAGTAHPILEHTHTELDYLGDGWIIGIRRFLQLVSAEIKLLDAHQPQTYRQGDSYIMDDFRGKGISTHELRTLNRCRLHYQVARLSDIATIVGTHLCAHALPLDRDKAPMSQPTHPQTKLRWPRQPRPGLAARKLWAKHLKATYLHTDGRLRTPLGKWTQPIDHRDRWYPTIYDASSGHIHQSDGTDYYQLTVTHTDRRYIRAKTDNPPRSVRTSGYPVDTMSILGQTHTSHYTHRNARAMPQTPGTTHHHRFGQLPDWKADPLRHTTIYEEHIHLLTSKSRIVVTDGGMEGGKGYFGVIIVVGKIVIACARGAARGDPRTMDSFRAEACGFLAGTCLLQLLTAAHPADQPNQTHTDSIHTNSASLLSRLEGATSECIPTGFWLKPGSDIIMQLAEELKPIHSLQRMYVKGHQDSTNRSADLTLPELCNVEADAEATIMRFQMRGPVSSVVPFPASIVNVCIQHQLTHSSLNSLLHEELTQADYWTYLEEKFHWLDHHYEATHRLELAPQATQ